MSNTNIYNFDNIKIPASIKNNIQFSYFYKNNFSKFVKLLSYYRWYPDKYLDSFSLIQPDSAVKLSLRPYQRIMLRTLARFDENYFCIPRSGGKSFIHILYLYIRAILFPNSPIAIFASTIDQATRIWRQTHKKIMNFFPLLIKFFKDEKEPVFSKNNARINFTNGSEITVLALAQTSKGERKIVGGIEEANLINNDLYEDAIAPIFVDHRILPSGCGVINPMEDSQKHRFTTSGFAGSSEFSYIKNISEKQINCNGAFVFGSDWRLIYKAGWVSLKEINRARRKDESAFRQNYLCQWIGVTEGALIDINKLISSRTLYYNDIFINSVGEKKFVISVDISGSGNAKTIASIGEVINNDSTGDVVSVKIIEIQTIEKSSSPSDKSLIIKKIWEKYGGNFNQSLSNVKAIIIDAQGMGTHIVQELMRNQTDENGKIYKSFDFSIDKPTNINTEPTEKNSPKILYPLNANNTNSTEIHSNFINMFSAGKVSLSVNYDRLIEELIKDKMSLKKEETVNIDDVYKIKLPQSLEEIKIQCDQIEAFIREVSNLKSIQNDTNSMRFSVIRNIKTIQKDRFSSIEYLLYYVNKHMNFNKKQNNNLENYIVGGKCNGNNFLYNKFKK